MNKKKSCVVGLDISKDTFNAHWSNNDKKYSNDRSGWNALLKDAPIDASYAMEATGNYHYRLAAYLHCKKKSVKIFNPLSVHYWIKHTMRKSQTDKIDARLISSYAGTEHASEIPDWDYVGPELARAKAIVTLLSGLSRIERRVGNLGHSVSCVVKETDIALNAVRDVEDILKEKQNFLESELCKIVKSLYPKQFKLLKTIPGIGSKTASVLLASCRGLSGFADGRHLSSFVGLVSSGKQSGTTVNVNGKIVKVGNVYLRSLLFMCAFVACRVNKPCIELYERLLAKGKPKMLALTAVMHRLVKISFGVVSSGQPFNGNKNFSLAMA